MVCSGPGQNAPQVHITSVEVQKPSLLGVKYFLSSADLTTQASFVLRVLSCVDSLCLEEVWIHTAVFLSVLERTAPLHMHFGGWLALLKPFIPYQCVKKLLGTGDYLNNLVFWRGSWYKFSLCPYFESCSCTEASIWPQLWPAQGHFPPVGTKVGAMRWSHPRCCTHRAQSCQVLVLQICVRSCTTGSPGFMAGRWVMWTCGFGTGMGAKWTRVLIPVGYVNVFMEHLKWGELCLQETQTHTSPDQVLVVGFSL